MLSFLYWFDNCYYRFNSFFSSRGGFFRWSSWVTWGIETSYDSHSSFRPGSDYFTSMEKNSSFCHFPVDYGKSTPLLYFTMALKFHFYAALCVKKSLVVGSLSVPGLSLEVFFLYLGCPSGSSIKGYH